MTLAKHARQVADNITGVAREVRVVDLPELPATGDVSDWLAADGDPGTLIDLCKAAPVYTPGQAEDEFPSGSEKLRSGPAIRSAAELRQKEFAPIKYVVPGYIAEGCTLLAGRPKLGKSWLMLDVALAVASGGTCLGSVPCEQGNVLYLALEDNERRLQSRIDKLFGAFAKEWPAALHYATEWPRANEGGIVAVRITRC